MSPSSLPPLRGTRTPQRRARTRATRAVALALSALFVASGSGLGPAAALGLATDPTPAPTSTPAPAPLPQTGSTPVPVTTPTPTGSGPCPPRTTPTLTTAPPAKTRPSAPNPAAPNPAVPNPAVPNPAVTTLPDGRTVTTTCALAPPLALVGPRIAPEHTVGGPLLAGPGVTLSGAGGASVPPPPEVTDVSYVIADMSSGAVLAAKSPHALLLPASTLKTLLALVVVPALDPSKVVTASDAEVSAEGTRVGLVAGNPYTVDQLLTGMVLVSGNDTAYALADAFGGRDKALAAMNAKAAALGAWDTVAVDPSGLDAVGQRCSAYDLALFGRAVMALPTYRAIARTPAATFPGGVDHTGKVFPPFGIQNHNTLLEHYPGAIGVKNGYTTGAQHTFVGAATRGGRTLIITEMGGITLPSWKPSAALLDWAFANAGTLRPVGQLVAPGAPQPPEWRGERVAASTTTNPPSTSSTTSPATASSSASTTTAARGSTSTPAVVAAPAPGSGPNSAAGSPALASVLTAAVTAARHPATYAVLAVLLAALAGWSLARRRRRAPTT